MLNPDLTGAFVGGTINAQQPAKSLTRPVLSLVFAKGTRPDAATLAALANDPQDLPAFAITHQPVSSAGWVELLVSGLAIDCAGLAPGAPVDSPVPGALLGLGQLPQGEALSLHPGPHLADAVSLLPVVRAVAGLAARLAGLPGVVAVCWNPANSWMAPAYFRKVTGDWLAGGAFPALGLVTLQQAADGAMLSCGLRFFNGQELRIPALDNGRGPADQARMAVRLINDLIGHGPVVEPMEHPGSAGEKLVLAPIPADGLVCVLVRRDGWG